MLLDSGSQVQEWMERAREQYRARFKRGAKSRPEEDSPPSVPGDTPMPPRHDAPVEEETEGSARADSVVSDPEPEDPVDTNDPRATRAQARSAARDRRNMSVVDNPSPSLSTPAQPADDPRQRRLERRAARREAQHQELMQASLLLLTEHDCLGTCEYLGG